LFERRINAQQNIISMQPHPSPEGVGFTDPLSGTLNHQRQGRRQNLQCWSNG
jgi:hypothetical protein